MTQLAKAILAGLAAAAAGTLPWALLVSLNLRYGSRVPWAVPIMAAYLWLYWRYVRGAGPPRSTAAARRAGSRLNPLTEEQWGLALLAGVLGLGTVLLFQGVQGRLVELPKQTDLDVARYPAAAVVSWLLMSAAVSGLVEETAFRGFLQRPVERRYGPTAAILITGLLFGFSHFTHPEVTIVLMPFYLAVAAVYGGLAYLTDSVLPGMVLHAGGNALGTLNLLTQGRSEWELSAARAPLIWETGADASFWITLAALLVSVAATAWAYAALARVRPAHANPWLRVPLDEYEAHMARPAVGQATMLAEVFGDALVRHRPPSLLGCAGGNGFDRIEPEVTTRILGIDINPRYLETLSSRLHNCLPGLELHEADINGQDLRLPPVTLVFAGLFFEHVDANLALVTARNLTISGGTLVTVLQCASPADSPVTASAHDSLTAVGAHMRLLDRDALVRMAGAAGFTLAASRAIDLPAGKSFVVLEFARTA